MIPHLNLILGASGFVFALTLVLGLLQELGDRPLSRRIARNYLVISGVAGLICFLVLCILAAGHPS